MRDYNIFDSTAWFDRSYGASFYGHTLWFASRSQTYRLW